MLNPNTQVDASLRVDRYTEFGTAWNPGLGIGWWPVPSVRLRASTGRAFRVPTYTERFYSDPANWARPEVGPEAAWAGEGGADLFLSQNWTASATIFGRLDHDVIDWLRPTVADRWRTYNIRDVDTVGFEVSVKRTMSSGSFVQAASHGLDVQADAVTQLSKLSSITHRTPSQWLRRSTPPAAFRGAPRLEYKHRTRSTGTSDYALFDLRISRLFGLYEVRLEGTNLGNAGYQEIVGVAMPGEQVTVSVAVRP